MFLATKWSRLAHTLSRGTRCITTPKRPLKTPQIEDWPSGYPRFTSLIAAHPSFHISRRFATLHARLLMLKQDRVSELEEKLEQLDRDESRKLFLASTRRDANMARRQVLSEIDSALREYDRQVEQNHRMLNYRPAPKRAVANLNNWVQGTVPLAREETAYLQRETDLLCVNVPTDNALVQLEEMIESVFVRFHKAYRKSARLNISRDKHVWIWSGGLLGRTARGLAVCLISTLLVVPVVVVSAVDSILLRLCIIFVATSAFILALSGFTKARTAEMLVAGATYTTVLVVFVAGNGLGS